LIVKRRRRFSGGSGRYFFSVSVMAVNSRMSLYSGILPCMRIEPMNGPCTDTQLLLVRMSGTPSKTKNRVLQFLPTRKLPAFWHSWNRVLLAKSFVKLDYLLIGIVGRVNSRGRFGRKRLVRLPSLFRIGRRVCGCSRVDLETLAGSHPRHHQRHCAGEFEFVHRFLSFLARSPPRGLGSSVYNCQHTMLNRRQKENELFRKRLSGISGSCFDRAPPFR